MTLTPRYYLRHDTPAGTRYAYPIALTGIESHPNYSSRTGAWDWDGRARLTVADPAEASVEVRGSWLIADAPIVQLRTERPGPRVLDGMAKRDEPDVDGPVSPDLAAAFANAPRQPNPVDVAHFSEHDAWHVCWRCRVYAATYIQQYADGPPIVTTYDLDGWAELRGGPDPEPGRTWTVDDPSLLAVYGKHTAHLWPGHLSGLRAEVGRQLKDHPLVGTFYDWHDRGRREPNYYGFDVRIRVPWQTPRTKTESFKPHGARKTRTRTVTDWAMDIHVQHSVPDGAVGPDKATALYTFDDQVRHQVDRFFPFGLEPRACDHCAGTGWVAPDA